MADLEGKKTLTQIAQELGVIKSSLYKRVCKEPLLSALAPYTEMVNKTAYYSEEAIEVIVNSPEFAQMKENSLQRQGANPNLNTLGEEGSLIIQTLQSSVELLQKQLKVKDEQLAEKDDYLKEQLNIMESQLKVKDAQINTLSNALKESQAIQSQTMLALQAAEALHNTTMQQLPVKKKKHWWQRERKNEDNIFDVDSSDSDK